MGDSRAPTYPLGGPGGGAAPPPPPPSAPGGHSRAEPPGAAPRAGRAAPRGAQARGGASGSRSRWRCPQPPRDGRRSGKSSPAAPRAPRAGVRRVLSPPPSPPLCRQLSRCRCLLLPAPLAFSPLWLFFSVCRAFPSRSLCALVLSFAPRPFPARRWGFAFLRAPR